MPECFFRLYFRSARVYLLLLFMGKILVDGKTSLHCS